MNIKHTIDNLLSGLNKNKKDSGHKVIKPKKKTKKSHKHYTSVPVIPIVLGLMVIGGGFFGYSCLIANHTVDPDRYQILKWDGGKIAGIEEGLYTEPENNEDEESSTTQAKTTQKKEIISKDDVTTVSSELSSEVPDIPDTGIRQCSRKDISTEFTDYNIGEYGDAPYVTVNAGISGFTEDEKSNAIDSYEYYSPLDNLGRCGYTEASIGLDIMPTEERGEIGMVKPTGWCQMKYPELIEGAGYLYNRCHLIGYQLTGENANECNLITGTRYLNVEGMLPFENAVTEYVKETGNHVLYRVTPLYKGNEPLSRGVLMEGYSIEDNGNGISFNVFCPNIQPGIEIDYRDGTSTVKE